MTQPDPLSPRARLGAWVERPRIQNLIITLICVNAVTLGLATFDTVTRHIGAALATFEAAVLTVFVLEIAAKLVAYDRRFFSDGWNVFDFLVVGISVMPGSGPFAVLRALRILRVLRLVAKVERLRMIVESLLRAVPGIAWIAFLLLLVFYIFGVIGTELFGERFPEEFGHLGLALYSLFQVMTLVSFNGGWLRFCEPVRRLRKAPDRRRTRCYVEGRQRRAGGAQARPKGARQWAHGGVAAPHHSATMARRCALP